MHQKYSITLAVAAALAIAVPVPAFAQRAARIELSAQPLDSALRVLGQQTQTNILFDPAGVRNLQAPSVSGAENVEEAIAKLLAGSGYTYRFVDARTITLLPADKKISFVSSEGESSREGTQRAANPGAQETIAAEDAPAEVQEIIVTGSRIRGAQPTGSSVIALGREELVSSGAPTTAELLRRVPQVSGLGAGEAAAAGTQGQFTDPGVIPTLALESIEIVADGASAIYGSDAVAGVANLVLRKDFDGGESFARYGGASGYHDYALGHIAGVTWSGGEGMIAAEYNYHTELRGVDRSFFRSDLRNRGGGDYRSNMCTPGNIVVGSDRFAIPAGGVTPATAGDLQPGIEIFATTSPARTFCRRRSARASSPPSTMI